jgi:hypothetical protein
MGLFQKRKGRLIFNKSGRNIRNIKISTDLKKIRIARALKVDRRIMRHALKKNNNKRWRWEI